ncbi:uncharacterized protein LOC144622876 [Crassostrea virginica]
MVFKDRCKRVHFKKQYDAVILYSCQDRDRAEALLTRLKDIFSENVGFNIALFDDPQYSRLEETLQMSAVALLLLTEDFCENAWPSLCNNSALMQSLYTKNPCTIIPVVMPNDLNVKVSIPMGLKCLKRLPLEFEDDLVKRCFSMALEEGTCEMGILK